MSQQIIEGIIDPVKMSLGIGALLRITFGMFLKTDLLLRRQDNALESQSLFPKQCESILRHCPGDSLRRKVEQPVPHIFPHGFYRGKDGGDGLAYSRGSFNE